MIHHPPRAISLNLWRPARVPVPMSRTVSANEKNLSFLANITCTDDSNHHECNHDPDLDGRHNDCDPNASEDGGERDVEAEEDEEEGETTQW